MINVYMIHSFSFHFSYHSPAPTIAGDTYYHSSASRISAAKGTGLILILCQGLILDSFSIILFMMILLSISECNFFCSG